MKTLLVDPTTIGIFKFAKKQIIIMGEIHGQNNCPKDKKNTRYINVKEFIPWYHDCIGREKTLDIFLEAGYSISKTRGFWNTLLKIYYNKINGNWNYGLMYLRNNLDICAPKNDKRLASYFKCPQNTRVHLCDVRFFYEFDTSSTKMCYPCIFKKLWILAFVYYKTPAASYKLLEIYEYLETFLFDTKSVSYHGNLHKKLRNILKINKQLRNIPSRSVRQHIEKWSENHRQKSLYRLKKQFLLIKKKYRNELVPFPQGFFPVSVDCGVEFEIARELLMDVLIVYMDEYTMARVFRVFADGTQPENIIVYVGAHHATLYYKLMNMIRAKKVLAPSANSDSLDNDSCVDITKFYNSCEKEKKILKK